MSNATTSPKTEKLIRSVRKSIESFTLGSLDQNQQDEAAEKAKKKDPYSHASKCIWRLDSEA